MNIEKSESRGKNSAAFLLLKSCIQGGVEYHVIK